MSARAKPTEPVVSAYNGRPVYKVLSAKGEPIHGGKGRYSLPVRAEDGTWTSGGWMPQLYGTVVCERGLYHLTTEPARWWLYATDRVFHAEFRGEVFPSSDPDKLGVHTVRLLYEVDWSEVGVWSAGEHQASGTDYVRASDSATVEAYGSATVLSAYYHAPSAGVTLHGAAVHIDRRGGLLVIRTAEGAGARHEEVPA